MRWIGFDITGGDRAPSEALRGARQALTEMDTDKGLTLVGPPAAVEALQDAFPGRVRLLPAAGAIAMAAEPVRAVRAHPDNPISAGLRALAGGEVDAFCTAGHSGVLLVSAGTVPGLVTGGMRPALAVNFCGTRQQPLLMLDVGLNTECRAAHLVHFAHLGARYVRAQWGRTQPRVALLNTGTEPGKGPAAYREAHRELEAAHSFDFKGNCESRSIFDPPADVLVCDGFTGNLLLKQWEAFHDVLSREEKTETFVKQFNASARGGLPVLGVNGHVLLGHGASDFRSFCELIKSTAAQIGEN